MTKEELVQKIEGLTAAHPDDYTTGWNSGLEAAARLARRATFEPTTPVDEPAGGEFEDPFEVRAQMAACSAEETAEAVAKITDAIGSLVGRVSDGEVHQAVTRGLDVALELADLAKRDLSALRDVLHEVE